MHRIVAPKTQSPLCYWRMILRRGDPLFTTEDAKKGPGASDSRGLFFGVSYRQLGLAELYELPDFQRLHWYRLVRAGTVAKGDGGEGTSFYGLECHHRADGVRDHPRKHGAIRCCGQCEMR